MTMASMFLPEDDQAYLADKGISYQLLVEELPGGGSRRGIVIPAFEFDAKLFARTETGLIAVQSCELLVLIPPGYATTKLDSFYTTPRLALASGADPDRATGQERLFGSDRQFWSRHLQDNEWRDGIDGLATYFGYVRSELRRAA